jgi:purine-cytosine permease-like protein
VPLFGVLAADYFLARRAWDLSPSSPSRWGMLAAWVLGLVAYQLVNPGAVGPWSAAWTAVASAIHFTPQAWMSASLFSFVVSLVLGYLFGLRSGRLIR